MNELTPMQRRIHITKLLAEQELLTTPHLAELFEVSPMTIHRDVEKLVTQGKARKVRGGVMSIMVEPVTSMITSERCIMCNKLIPSRLDWIVTPKERPRWHACCSHCGLLQLHHCEGVQSALSADFLYGYMVNIYQAWYVVGSRIYLCCMPSTLCFGSQGDAIDFQKGFGGEVMDFETAMKRMAQTHHPSSM